MGEKSAVDPTLVMQSLVYTLLDVFDATRDLYQTLKSKEKRDYEQSLRSRGYSSRRAFDYVDEKDDDGYEGLVMDKAAVNRQFDLGIREIGSQFAVGDVLTQTALQSQIITLQSVIITTFLYGPTSPDPISTHLKTLVAASREAGTTAVDTLRAQELRQMAMLPRTPRSRSSARSPERRSIAQAPAMSSTSTALVKARRDPSEDRDLAPAAYPAMTTILANRPTMPRTDTESTAFSGPTAYDTEAAPHTAICLYALDLQRHPSQPLSSTITQDPSPYCPYCRRTLLLSPGKSWEVLKDDRDRGLERCFRVSNRFVVKCHRNSVDGGYCCVLCSRGTSSVNTVCGDVKAMIKHVWMDHSIGELEAEEDVEEIFGGEGEDGVMPLRRKSGRSVRSRRDSARSVERRDSGYGGGARERERERERDRRSASLGPRRRRFEKEVETWEVRPSQRGSVRERD